MAPIMEVTTTQSGVGIGQSILELSKIASLMHQNASFNSKMPSSNAKASKPVTLSYLAPLLFTQILKKLFVLAPLNEHDDALEQGQDN